MKKKTDILTSINIEPITYSLIIFYSDQWENITKHLNKKSNKNISDYLKERLPDFTCKNSDANGTLVLADEVTPVLMYIKPESKGRVLNTIVHEVNHVVEYFADNLGFQDEKEFKAYLSADIFTKIVNKIL